MYKLLNGVICFAKGAKTYTMNENPSHALKDDAAIDAVCKITEEDRQ